MATEFSQFGGPGMKYAPKRTVKMGDGRRTPSRSRQVARGKGSPSGEPDMVKQARRDMTRYRSKK